MNTFNYSNSDYGKIQNNSMEGAATPAALINNLNKHDTSTSNQRAIVLRALRAGPKTTIQLKDDFGVMAPAARISELRRLEYKIRTGRVNRPTTDGVMHFNVAIYILLPKVEI